MNLIQLKNLLKGILTFIPGIKSLRKLEGGGASSARYCYALWLRHLVLSFGNGMPSIPKVVAELGSGDSIGAGLAALLSGSVEYYAFDVVKFADLKRNIVVFDELVDLFQRRTDIPDDTEFPFLWPKLDSYKFPADILTDSQMKRNLDPYRIGLIRNALENNKKQSGEIRISYFAPWYDAAVIRSDFVDMIFSQAVMEHVDFLQSSYEAMYRWLKPGGFISHEIDFKSHGTAKQWNGHLGYSNLNWKLMKGNRPYFLNREPCSTHVMIIRQNKFKIIFQSFQRQETGIMRSKLAKRFRDISSEDLTTSSMYLLAKK